MRVLHLITWLNPGGIEHWLSGFAMATLNTDIDMTIVCRSRQTGSLAEGLQKAGVPVMSCPMLPNLATYDRRLAKVVRQTRADIVHIHLGATSLLAVRAAKRTGIPVITTFHSPQFAAQTTTTRKPLIRYARNWYVNHSIEYALRHSNLVTGVSRGVLRTIAPGFESDNRYRVTYLGIPDRESHQCSSLNLREAKNWSPKCPLIAKLGRLAPEKDPLASLEVFRLIHKRIPDAKFVLFGEGPLKDELNRRVNMYGLADSIWLMGYRADASNLLKQVNLLLHPSRYEGFGLAVVEAAAAGVPSIATDIPGLDEAVVHGATGYLHKIGDLDGMARNAVALLTDPDLYRKMSRNGIDMAITNFSSAKCHSNMLDVYRELVAH